jgi:hypothetical protein
VEDDACEDRGNECGKLWRVGSLGDDGNVGDEKQEREVQTYRYPGDFRDANRPSAGSSFSLSNVFGFFGRKRLVRGE